MDGHTGLMQNMVWTMLLLAHVCLARASSLTRYCPDFGDVKFGDSDPADGVPKHVHVTFERWKGNEDGRLPPRTLIIPRNYNDIKFCPVFHLATWCELCRANGISNGPLFRKLTRGHHDFSRPFEELEEHTWENWIQQVCERAGGVLKHASSHSIRRDCGRYWTRCCSTCRTEVRTP